MLTNESSTHSTVLRIHACNNQGYIDSQQFILDCSLESINPYKAPEWYVAFVDICDAYYWKTSCVDRICELLRMAKEAEVSVPFSTT